jgi:hypothetical protein
MDGRTVVPAGRLAIALMRGLAAGLICSLSSKATCSPDLKSLTIQPVSTFSTLSGESTMNDARYLAYLSLSVASFGASVMFLLMFFNPKETSYTTLPAIYAGLSLAVGVVTYFLAKRAEVQPVAVNAKSQ